jgi:hypothetical protein
MSEPKSKWNTMLELSPEDTAKWLSGEQPVDWMANLTDPEERQKYLAHQRRMHKATITSAQLFVKLLEADSDQSARRMKDLLDGALAGDTRSAQLLFVMMTTLMRTGLELGAL